jgi:putative transposase
VELNPVRANITQDPLSYEWSSAKSHVLGQDNSLVQVKPLLDLVPAWQVFLQEGIGEEEYHQLKRHERTGRPLGDEHFINKIENAANRFIRKKKPGPKKKADGQ